MSWSKDKLRALAIERGEGEKAVGILLLAHERMRGRTEEDYARDTAEKELDALLERHALRIPGEVANEYPGLKQLRGYASDQALSRAVGVSSGKGIREPVKADAVQQGERVYRRDHERELG